MKKAIVFDLDGTLLNTLEDLKDSVNYALEKHGYPQRTLEDTRKFVGNGVRKLMERSAPKNISAEEFEACFNDFCTYYKLHMEDKTAEYDGVTPMLSALFDAGYQMAIVTNKQS